MDVKIERELNLIRESVLAAVPDTEAIYLFGSHAYGTPDAESDLDIYVVVPDNLEGSPLDAGVAIRRQLRRKKTMPLDLLLGRSSVFHRRAQGLTLESEIANKGVQIYAS